MLTYIDGYTVVSGPYTVTADGEVYSTGDEPIYLGKVKGPIAIAEEDGTISVYHSRELRLHPQFIA